MAAGGEIGGGTVDFYAVLGLEKQCSAADLRNAYKKLAMRWHPDRCSAAGKSEAVEEAKVKFQSIQEAYAVLSDANKRFLYDVGVLDGGDDGGAYGDFLREMIALMNETPPGGSGNATFEELQSLFAEMFDGHTTGGAAVTRPAEFRKRGGAAMCSAKAKVLAVANDAARNPRYFADASNSILQFNNLYRSKFI